MLTILGPGNTEVYVSRGNITLYLYRALQFKKFYYAYYFFNFQNNPVKFAVF